MVRRRSSSRLPGGVLLGAAALFMLSGCAAPASPDPALVALAEEALSVTRSAALGIDLREGGDMYATTTHALLGDMQEKLADVAREASVFAPSDPSDAAYRRDLLEASAEAMDAMHAADAGAADAGSLLDDSADRLEVLVATGGGS